MDEIDILPGCRSFGARRLGFDFFRFRSLVESGRRNALGCGGRLFLFERRGGNDRRLRQALGFGSRQGLGAERGWRRRRCRHPVVQRVNLGPQFLDRLAVHRHSPRQNHLLAGAPRGHAGLRQKFLQPNHSSAECGVRNKNGER